MKDCLERAMFTASESYSHTAYDVGEFGCGEEVDKESQATYSIANQSWIAVVSLNAGERQ